MTRFLVLFLVLFLLLPAPAFTAERDYPLVSSDARVLEGNEIFESAFRKLEKELDVLVEKYATELRPDIQILFDDSQMDWIVCFNAEAKAFRPTDVWTRENASGDIYENLYQQNMLFALSFRIGQIREFQGEVTTEPRYDEARQKILLAEIEEAQYRATSWTEERLRPRLYRADKAWEAYRAGVRKFAEALGWEEARIMELDFLLLEYRLTLLSRQKEALFRLKFEAEE